MARAKLGRFKSREARAEFLRRYDEILALWPAAAEELDVDTRFGSTHTRRSGDPSGSTVVLLHPHTGTSLAWHRLVRPLAEKHQVIALDTIGALGRSVQTAPLAAAGDYAMWIDDVLRGLRLDGPPHLVGYSEGGYVALCAAAGSTPLRSVVAIEPGGAIAPVRLKLLAAMVVAGVETLFSDKALQRFAERISPGVEFAPGEMEMAVYGARNFRQGLPFPKRFDDERLEEMTVPTLLYMGEKTELYDPMKAAARAEALRPAVLTVIVPDARHGLPFQFPDATTKAILGFIDGVEARES